MTIEKSKMGKASRAAGKRFELKVRADLESKGWIVFRNSNDVKPNKLSQTTFSQTTGHWNPFTNRIMTAQSGFPDFICVKQYYSKEFYVLSSEVQFVESKMAGYLGDIEKEKVKWIKDNLKIPVIVAFKGKKRGEIVYERV